jgi:branched-chain amino acid transport system substrate-binding protein
VGWVIFSPSKKSGPADTITIGYFGPFTGLLAQSTGESVAEGFKLAEKESNKFGNKTVKVVYEDDSCDPKKAVSAAQKLIEVDKVKILISGVCSSSTLGVAPIAESNKVILISPTSASPKITDAGDYIFRLSSPTTGMAKAASDYATSMGYKKVGLLFENNEYPAGWKDSFLNSFKGEVVVEGVTPGSTDVKSQLLKLSQAKPDVYVFTTITPSVANIALKQYKELGLSGPIIGNDTFSTKAVNQTPDANGIFVITYDYDLLSDKMVSFLRNYKEEHSKDAKEEIYAALGYDTYMALFNAIKACDGDNPECIKEKLYSAKNVNGISGLYSIDENGDTQRNFVVRKVTNGSLVNVR